jgi:hypothetical protein
LRVGAVVAVAAAAGVVAWLLLRDEGGSSTATTTQTTPAAGAVAVSPGKLASLATSLRQPIFWLGRRTGDTYELTLARNGKIYVRYLPSGVAVGAAKPYLTVATYPFPGAYAAISKQAAAKGAITAKLARGGVALLDNGYPQSVHIAYPGLDYQVEVYDPTPNRAMQLASAGEVAALGWPSRAALGGSEPVAASVDDLKALAARLGHPIYWAGPKRGFTYELTRTSNGSVFVRYLPAGVKLGDPRPRFLTVATYPFPGAYPALAKTAKGQATVKVARGGMAVVDRAYPKSIHLAFPRSGYQIEVFDPSPSAGRKLVASGAIAPLG